MVRKYIKKLENLVLIFLVVALFPFLFIAIFLRFRKTKNNQLKILIIPQLSRMGDIICSTPVLRAIKAVYPKSYLSVLTSNKAIGILKNNSRIDEIINVDDYTYWGLIKKIRQEKFDWSFCLSAISTFSIAVSLGLVRNRVKLTRSGRSTSEIFTDWMCNYRCFYKDGTSAQDCYMKMLEPLGIKGEPLIQEVFTSVAGDQKAKNFFESNSISSGDLCIGISITAGNKIKEWGDEKFTALAVRVADTYKAKILFIGAKNDNERINKILLSNNRKDFLSATDFSMEELPSLIKKLDLFIAVDNGPIHVAHALGVPSVDIMGPVDPKEQPPEDDVRMLVLPPSHIKPSVFISKKPGKPQEHKVATDSIKIEDVFSAVTKMLSNIEKKSNISE